MSQPSNPESNNKEVSNLANALFVEGVKAGVAAARDIIAEGFSDTYEFESLILHRLHIIDSEHRILRGSDIEKPYPAVLQEAREQLQDQPPSDSEFIHASVSEARTAYEAWVIHRELTNLSRNHLSASRREQLASAISERFPD